MTKLNLIAAAGIALISGGLWGAAGIALAITLLTLILTAVFYRTYALVDVSELENLVVFKANGRKFSRFLPSGRHWINPFIEGIGGTISTAGQSQRGRCAAAQTSGGLPISIDWAVHFQLNTRRIDSQKAAKLARALPDKAQKMIEQHANHILHHLLGRYTINQLLEPGIHERLERELRSRLRGRLENSGFEISRVMIEALHKPQPVVAAIEAAHGRELQTRQEAQALERLQQVISRFSEEDMGRLIELERIHALSKGGAIWVESPHNFPGGEQLAAGLFGRQTRKETVIIDPQA